MQYFDVSTSRFDGGAAVIAIEGELDRSTIDRVRTPAQEAVATGRPLVFDLSACTFVDSSALRLVLQVRRALDETAQAVPMAIVAGSSPVRKMFSITAIDQSVPLFDTRAEAQRWLRSPDAARQAATAPASLS